MLIQQYIYLSLPKHCILLPLFNYLFSIWKYFVVLFFIGANERLNLSNNSLWSFPDSNSLSAVRVILFNRSNYLLVSRYDLNVFFLSAFAVAQNTDCMCPLLSHSTNRFIPLHFLLPIHSTVVLKFPLKPISFFPRWILTKKVSLLMNTLKTTNC